MTHGTISEHIRVVLLAKKCEKLSARTHIHTLHDTYNLEIRKQHFIFNIPLIILQSLKIVYGTWEQRNETINSFIKKTRSHCCKHASDLSNNIYERISC
jgi:hypothetical protein